MVLQIFSAADFRVTRGDPSTYTHVSDGSGKEVYIHFCDRCGTKLFFTFERFQNSVGVCTGTFDNPNALVVSPERTKHIFLNSALRGTIIPPGVNTYREHAMTNDGSPIEPTVYDTATTIGA